MIKSKFWKLQSNEKLSSKKSYTSSPTTPPLVVKKTQSFIYRDKPDFEDFQLTSLNQSQSKESQSSPIDSVTSKPKNSQNIKFQQIQKKVKERQQDRKNKGLTIKMKLKLQEQLRAAQKQLEQKQSELSQMESQISLLNNLIKQRKKHSQDIVNNEQMLKFKQGQLTNLNTIHSQIVEGAKRQIAKQKMLKTQNEQKLKYVRKKLSEQKLIWRQKHQKLFLIEQLNKQKSKLEKYLQEQRASDNEKVQMQAESVREIIEHLVKKNKKAIEEECQWKVKIIRECGNAVKKVTDLKVELETKGIKSHSYYTFGQLKRVQELNFRVNKQAEKIFDILHKQINPRVVEIIEHFQQPKELLQLKVQLSKMEQLRTLSQGELKRKQKEIEQLQAKRKKAKESVVELKKKNQVK